MDGASQGPKIHITVTDAFDREHQLATVHVNDNHLFIYFIFCTIDL